MQPVISITPSQLPDVLLRIAPARPVFLWSSPGLGKSTIVSQVADAVSLPLVSLLGSQLAAEDLIGVPDLYDAPHGRRSRFAPPELIARPDPYVLFLDELNGSDVDVMKAFYSLVLDRRLGNYELHPGSIVIAAGNRSTDGAIVRQMPTALVNRFCHIHVRASADDWLVWAADAGVDSLVVDYIRHRPDHLAGPVPKVEEPFSTPRTWHYLSDLLQAWGQDITLDDVAMLAHGCLTPSHAASFVAFAKVARHKFDLEAILKGSAPWPSSVEDRDVLHFLAVSFRAKLIKELPASAKGGSAATREFAMFAKTLLVSLSEVSFEMAQLVVAADEDGHAVLPAWWMAEVVRDLPRLAAGRS